MAMEIGKRSERRPPPKGGWPKAAFVPQRSGSQQYRCRKVVAGLRWTEWGTDPEDALDAWKAWWNAGCPTRDQQKEKSTSALALDEDPDARPPATVAELFDRFLTKRKASLARSTHKRYERDIRLRLKPRFGQKAFPLDRPTIVRWKEALEEANLPTTSIRRCMTVVQSAFTWAISQGWCTENPAAKIAMPKSRARVRAQQARDVAPPPLDIPTVEEVRAFLRAAKEAADPLYVMWRTGFKLGPRPGELAAMSESQLLIGPSGSFQFVGVHQKLVRGDSTPAVKDANGRIISPRIEGEIILERPKWDGDRDIELDPDDPLFEDLIGQAELMREMASKHGWDPKWAGCLFRRLPGGRQGRGGDLYAPDTLPDLFKKAAERAGWPKGRTPHFMRHFAASNLIRRGFTTKEACEILGHSTVRTFEETYLHVIREVRRGVRLSEAIADLD